MAFLRYTYYERKDEFTWAKFFQVPDRDNSFNKIYEKGNILWKITSAALSGRVWGPFDPCGLEIDSDFKQSLSSNNIAKKNMALCDLHFGLIL